MRIAVNNIFFEEERNTADAIFVQQLLLQLVEKHAANEFVFFDIKEVATAPNITTVLSSKLPANSLALKYWNNVQLPLKLKKENIDLLIQPYGSASLTAKTKQVLIISSVLAKKKINVSFLEKAASIVVSSAFAKEHLITNYKINAEKIQILYGTANAAFKPLGYIERTIVKDEFSTGKEYFLLAANPLSIAALLHILKAFSLFKKWQKSSMKLLVAGKVNDDQKGLAEKLSTYKFREDVVFLNDVSIEKEATITASSYAVIYYSTIDGFGIPILQAMQSEVPVIASDTAYNNEVGSDNILYAPGDDIETLANQMKLLYKDENLRSDLIAKSIERVKQFVVNPEILIA